MRLSSRELTALRQRRSLPRSEADVQRAILAYLATLSSVRAFRMNSRVLRMPGRDGRDRLVRFGGQKGMPDIIGWLKQSSPARAVWFAIEVKRPGLSRPRAEQARFLEELRADGGLSILATSVDDVTKILHP